MSRNNATISITILPSGKTELIARPKTALQLLNRLGLRAGMALVIRDGELLTPDRAIMPDDEIIIRKVISEG